MKIIALEIYGYGKLENVTFTNLQPFQVFYGENEAGKSTIMSFIHSILFGFPTKQQSELRYEPKTSTKYGGRLIAEFPHVGVATIERVKGKATGDVLVTLENGEQGGEEMLAELMSHIDKAFYQAIYSFNIHGLQNIHTMKKEDLGRFLFSTGVLGTERLLLAENVLQKEMDARFKPNGKKPILNEQLTELKRVHTTLKKAELENEQYNVLIRQTDELKGKLDELKLQKHSLQQQLNKVQQWTKLLPSIQEAQLLREEIAELGVISFPIDGLTRFEQLQQLLKPIEAQIMMRTERLKQLQQELEEQKPNKVLLNKEADILAVIENYPLYERMIMEESQLQSQRQMIDEQINQIKDQFHFSIDEEALSTINTGIFMREKVSEAQKVLNRLTEKKNELDERFNEEKRALEVLEFDLNRISEQLLSKEDQEKMREFVLKWQDQNGIERELQQVREQMVTLKSAQKAEISQRKRQAKRQRLFMLLLVAVMFAVIVWGLVSHQIAISVAGAAGLIVLGLFRTNQNKTTSDFIRKQLEALQQRERTLIDSLAQSGTSDVLEMQAELVRNDRLEEQRQSLLVKLEQQQSLYDRIIQGYEQWELEMAEHNSVLGQIYQELNIPTQIPPYQLENAFDLLAKLKSLFIDRDKIVEQLVAIQNNKKQFSTRLVQLSQAFIREVANDSVSEAITSLRQMLKEEQTKNIRYNETEKVQSEMEIELQEQILSETHLRKEIDELFAKAGVEHEDAFRELGKTAEKFEQLNNRLMEIDRQLKLFEITDRERNEIVSSNQLQEQEQSITDQLTECDNQIFVVQDELAALSVKISLLEGGERYSELLHQYKQLKFQFAQEAKVWTKYALAKKVLEQTVDRYKNQRLPVILKKAEQYLAFLTSGKYVRIFQKQEEAGFLIERQDHVFFAANELSQATSEQVYVALRLAFATSLYEQNRFPIIIDDSFVNFDQTRTNRVLELLKGISGHQIIFFTCHQSLLQGFENEQMVMLSS